MEPLKLGEVIGKARKAKAMSLRELSRRTGISHPYLSQIETGKNDNPSKDFLLKLADELELPFVFLLSISSTDLGLLEKVSKDVIDRFRYNIPPYIDNIDPDFFIDSIKSQEHYKNNPDYYTEEMIMEIKKFIFELKVLEGSLRIRPRPPSIDIILERLKNTSTTPTTTINNKPTLTLKEYLSNENVEITVNDKTLSEENKLKLIEIANTIFN